MSVAMRKLPFIAAAGVLAACSLLTRVLRQARNLRLVLGRDLRAPR
jgi:hypothetical protein